MNKERAINILLEHAKRSMDNNDDAYAINKDALTAAILFLEHDRPNEQHRQKFKTNCPQVHI